MKKILLLLLALDSFYSIAQLARAERNDTALDKRIRKLALNDNQYLDLNNNEVIALFNIVPDKSLKNKDSLLQDSKHIYEDMLHTVGKKLENEIVDISYWGKETDKDNSIFSYSHNQYTGQANYHYQIDTLLAPDSNVRKRLNRLSYNKYVRHEYYKSGLSIIFYVISKDANLLNQKTAEADAIKFLLKFIDAQYCYYTQI